MGQRFDDEVDFLRELVKVPSDNPPGDCAPCAERAATLLRMTNAFATQDYDEALRLAERGVEIHPLLDALSLAWAQVGAVSPQG